MIITKATLNGHLTSGNGAGLALGSSDGLSSRTEGRSESAAVERPRPANRIRRLAITSAGSETHKRACSTAGNRTNEGRLRFGVRRQLVKSAGLVWLLLHALFAFAINVSAAPTPATPATLFSRPLMVPDINPSFKPDPFASRSVFGTVDLSLLGASGPHKLLLNLFDNTLMTAVRDRVEMDSLTSFTWYGAVEGEDLSSVILSVSNGRLAGMVRTVNLGSFSIFPASPNLHLVSQLNYSAAPRDAEPLEPPTSFLQSRGYQPPPQLAKRDVYPINTPVIDVMVVYTASVRSKFGGTTNTLAQIRLGIDETNAAYQNSGVTQRVRLVYAYEAPGFEESDMYTDLDRLTGTSDGSLDEIHGLRDTYGADLVSLWTNNTDYCGLAWLAVNPSYDYTNYGFSVISYTCATGYYSFGQ